MGSGLLVCVNDHEAQLTSCQKIRTDTAVSMFALAVGWLENVEREEFHSKRQLLVQASTLVCNSTPTCTCSLRKCKKSFRSYSKNSGTEFALTCEIFSEGFRRPGQLYCSLLSQRNFSPLAQSSALLKSHEILWMERLLAADASKQENLTLEGSLTVN